eukprot:COSAG02_NODE_20223_length_842_cov_1.183042_2_plen_48_part_01
MKFDIDGSLIRTMPFLEFSVGRGKEPLCPAPLSLVFGNLHAFSIFQAH